MYLGKCRALGMLHLPKPQYSAGHLTILGQAQSEVHLHINFIAEEAIEVTA